MRRMYSEQELTKIIKEVSESYIDELIEDGVFDTKISDYVDAYLVEHPVDITALEGQTIAPENVYATGNITAESIIENMSGYSITPYYDAQLNPIYYSVSKTGNKLTFVFFGTITRDATKPSYLSLVSMIVPNEVKNKLYTYTLGSNTHIISANSVTIFADMDTTKNIRFVFEKWTNNLDVVLRGLDTLTDGAKYFFRIEQTFLLSNNLVS